MKFLGSVLPQEVPKWLNQCDVGVLATRQEVFLDLSFSNKLSEYIIMGKPLIASRLKAIRHYFSEGALAFFSPENAAGLADQIVKAVLMIALSGRGLAQRAYQEYEPIRWEVMKGRHLRVIGGLISEEPMGNEAMESPMVRGLAR